MFRANKIIAFKEAMEKEKSVYASMGVVKDDLDSQHFWAGGRIKNMQGKMNMNFKGPALLQRKSSSVSQILRQESQKNKHITVEALEQADNLDLEID